MATTTISFKTDNQLLDRLQELAVRSQRSVSSIIREAVAFWLIESPNVAHIDSTPENTPVTKTELPTD